MTIVSPIQSTEYDDDAAIQIYQSVSGRHFAKQNY